MGGIKNPEARWPLSFRISLPQPGAALTSAQLPSWSHELYRGPDDQPVKVLYSSNRQDSERIAQEFLDETVVGFDMEWNWYVRKDAPARLQERVGLIQIACEDKIALFHIGLHRGTTPDEVIAPSLRKLLESPDIVKTGVNIIKADVSRLRQWFELNPRGNIELSHLHNLVTYGIDDVSRCTTHLFSLQKHVEEHLGFTLPKGGERMSRWSGHLSSEQKKYAAADAYAGFMLYHCMNAKRAAMTPSPPLPIHAELYNELGLSTALRLQPVGHNLEMISVVDFFQPLTTAEVAEVNDEIVDRTPVKKASRNTTPRSERRTPRTKVAEELEEEPPETEFSLLLFDRLKAHRSRIASTRRTAPYMIASDKTLRLMSKKCPGTKDDLLAIHGIGKVKVDDFGADWLAIVVEATKEERYDKGTGPLTEKIVSTTSNPATTSEIGAPRTVAQDGTNIATTNSKIRGPPTLHTGLSFALEQSALTDVAADTLQLPKDDESSSTSAFETDSRESSPADRKRKR